MSAEIIATIKPVASISGKIQNQASISGSVNGISKISGEVNPQKQVDASVSLFGDKESVRYSGDHEFTADTDEDYSVDTKFKMMSSNIVIKKVPYFETSNPSGTTIYIGE